MTDPAAPLAVSTTSASAPVATARMQATAQEFEAAFLSQMLKPMFDGLATDGMFGGGEAEGTWRGFLVDAMARTTARSGGVGLADTVLAEMIRMQEQVA